LLLLRRWKNVLGLELSGILVEEPDLVLVRRGKLKSWPYHSLSKSLPIDILGVAVVLEGSPRGLVRELKAAAVLERRLHINRVHVRPCMYMLRGRGRWLGGLCFAELLVLIASIPALGDPVAHVVDGDAVSRVAAELPLTTVVLYNSLNNILFALGFLVSE